MGLTNSNKIISTERIDCFGSLKVTLALTAAPDITANPADIALVLDRSGSMAGEPMENLKIAAKKFVDIIEEATDGTADGVIGSGSRIGIVSFADAASQDRQLITSVDSLDEAIDSLTAEGETNHGDAFLKAIELFEATSSNAKIMIMFTDGNTTTGPNPSPIAAAAKAQGIVIYCIGLVGAGGIDVAMLNDWATAPASAHVAIAPTADDLEDLFADLASNITKPGATDIVINETVNSDFEITSILLPTKGTAFMTGTASLRWNIDELGTSGSEAASLQFIIRHVSDQGGIKYVNESIEYSDNEGNQATFPEPAVEVDCNIPVNPEPCPEPISIETDVCEDSVIYASGDVYMQSMGRILQLDVNIKNVCPNKRVALGIILTEEDENGNEYHRGVKTLTIPAHDSPACRDVLVKCVKFVLPEDLNTAGEAPYDMCRTRSFKARFIAHHIDSDFDCCDSVL